jgi:hypothetical protein
MPDIRKTSDVTALLSLPVLVQLRKGRFSRRIRGIILMARVFCKPSPDIGVLIRLPERQRRISSYI